jgi:hypothetical protein
MRDFMTTYRHFRFDPLSSEHGTHEVTDVDVTMGGTSAA